MSESTIQYVRCPHCNMLVAKTKYNPNGICPAYACKTQDTFIQDATKESYETRMSLNNKYRGLYFYAKSYTTLHFLNALSNRNLLFISDTNYALFVFNEQQLDTLYNIFEETNYNQFREPA